MTPLSVIIPLCPNETSWKDLLSDLAHLPDHTEIILVSATTLPKNTSAVLPNHHIKWLKAPPGRAAHLNAGAKAAKGTHLWFVHADSRITINTIPALLKAITIHPQDILFCDLSFFDGHPLLMRLTAFGTWLRSRLLKLPFGDQGLCMHKDIFKTLEGFNEHASYGEDHLLIWQAKKHHIPITPIKATLQTSARKYKQHGWLRVTLSHQYLWIKQAWKQI